MFLELIYSGWWSLLGNSFNNCQLLFSSLHSNSIGRGLQTITVCHTTRTNEQLILFAVAASVLPSTCAWWLPCPPIGTLPFIRISPVVREAPTTATWRAARSLRQGDQKKTSLRTQLSSTHKLFFLPFFPDLLSKARVVGVMQIHSSRCFISFWPYVSRWVSQFQVESHFRTKTKLGRRCPLVISCIRNFLADEFTLIYCSWRTFICKLKLNEYILYYIIRWLLGNWTCIRPGQSVDQIEAEDCIANS